MSRFLVKLGLTMRRLPAWVLLIAGCVQLGARASDARTTTSSLTTTITTVQCASKLEPKTLVVRQFADDLWHQLTIRCEANLTQSQESFTNPVFDLSFGDNSNTGLFIVRGEANCGANGRQCYSEFRLPSQALRQLLLPRVNTTNASHSHLNSRVNHHASAVKITCDVADTSRNTRLTVRCSDTSTIQFAKVLRHQEKCFTDKDALDECGENMVCSPAFQCLCKAGYFGLQVSSTTNEVICTKQVSLGQKCSHFMQCKKNDWNSLCEFDSLLKSRICKCESGFEESRNLSAKGGIYCKQAQISTPESTSLTDVNFVKPNSLVTNSSKEFKVENDKKIPRPYMFSRLSKSAQIGLIAFSAVLLLTIIILAVIVRTRRKGKMKLNEECISKDDKSQGNGQSGLGPLLSDKKIEEVDEEEEVVLAIDDLNESPQFFQSTDKLSHLQANYSHQAKQSVV